MQGAIVFIGSVSSRGNKGQISYATTKAGLEGAAATLMKEAMFYGVRCGIIHPGFTDTQYGATAWKGFLGKVRVAVHAASPVDSHGGDCGRDLLHDFQLGGQWRAVGRRRLASARLMRAGRGRNGAGARPTAVKGDGIKGTQLDFNLSCVPFSAPPKMRARNALKEHSNTCEGERLLRRRPREHRKRSPSARIRRRFQRDDLLDASNEARDGNLPVCAPVEETCRRRCLLSDDVAVSQSCPLCDAASN